MKEDAKERKLPENETCSTCIHFERCHWHLVTTADMYICYWKPGRFQKAVK